MPNDINHELFQGIWTALWTPVDEKGALKTDAIKKHLDFLIGHGVNGVAVGGSTGQFPYLDVATRKELLHLVVQHIGPNRVFANISSIRQEDVKELAKSAKEEKVAAIMLLPQMYFPYEQLDLTAYFVAMAKIAERPLILYNYPECVRNRIELETIDNVSGEVPVAGIKQSGSDFAYHLQLIELGKKNNFHVFTGADPRLQEVLKMGASGNIGGLSNVIPDLMVAIYQGFKKNDQNAMDAAGPKVSKIERVISRVPFPVNIQALMEAKGFDAGVHKEILSSTTLYEYGELVAALKDLFAKGLT